MINNSVKIAMASLMVVMGCGCLFGCSSGANHQVIDQDKDCTSCHQEKTTYDVTSPSEAAQTGRSFTIKTDAETVVLCKPVFIDEKGTKCVPREYKEYKVNGSLVTITAEPGIWAVAIDKGDSSTYKIVNVKDTNDVVMFNL